MTPAELQAWQDRTFGPVHGAQVRAAKALAVPNQTYRNWLFGRRPMPEPAALLARYVETFGPLDS